MRAFALLLAGAIVTGPAASWAESVPIAFIGVGELHALVARGMPPILVDVRSREEYEARHITGAVSIPLTEVSGRAREIPRSPLVVLY